MTGEGPGSGRGSPVSWHAEAYACNAGRGVLVAAALMRERRWPAAVLDVSAHDDALVRRRMRPDVPVTDPGSGVAHRCAMSCLIAMGTGRRPRAPLTPAGRTPTPVINRPL